MRSQDSKGYKVVNFPQKLTAFLELESAIREASHALHKN
jgi:hypothetical protein